MAGRSGSSQHRGKHHVQELSERSGLPLARAEESQAGGYHEQGERSQRTEEKYFGPEGELFKKREALMGPIQEEIYNAVKEVSDLRGYSLVLDRASNSGIIFGSPKIDISNEVLKKLGYSAN